MLTKTTIALAAAAALFVGVTSAASANEIDESVSSAQAARESQGNQLPWWWNQKQPANPSSAYGSVPTSKPAR
jgi:hypothetical protein